MAATSEEDCVSILVKWKRLTPTGVEIRAARLCRVITRNSLGRLNRPPLREAVASCRQRFVTMAGCSSVVERTSRQLLEYSSLAGEADVVDIAVVMVEEGFYGVQALDEADPELFSSRAEPVRLALASVIEALTRKSRAELRDRACCEALGSCFVFAAAACCRRRGSEIPRRS